MRIDVKGGTPSIAKDLCLTCLAGFIRESAQGKMTKYCNLFGRDINEVVVKCNMFNEKNDTDLQEMKQMAWFITPNAKGRGLMGFKSNKDLTPEEREQINSEV
jgi:hypothetical protein